MPLLRSCKRCSKLMIKHGMKQHVTKVKVDDLYTNLLRWSLFFFLGSVPCIFFPLVKASVMCILHTYISIELRRIYIRAGYFEALHPSPRKFWVKDLKESNLPLKKSYISRSPPSAIVDTTITQCSKLACQRTI